MTKQLREPTTVELVERTPEGQREMAAARLELRAAALLAMAMEACGLSQKELAETLGVTEGRVSQVISGDGNLRISTLARYLRAMGYTPTMDAEPTSPTLPRLGERRRQGRRRGVEEASIKVFVSIAQNKGQTHPVVTLLPSGVAEDGYDVLARRFLGVLNERSSISISGTMINSLVSGRAH